MALTESKSTDVALTMVDEINHRVMNEYTEAIATLSVAQRSLADPAARDILKTAASRLDAHAAAHRALLRPNGGGLIDAGEYVERVCLTISNALLEERGATMRLETEEIPLSPDRCWRLGLIVSELLRNAVRHGLSRSNGTIVVRLCRRGHLVSCAVSNGAGGRASPGSGRGRQLVHVLASEMGGSVEWIFSEEGAFVRVEAPLDDLMAL